MVKEITCQHCKKELAQSAFHFDADSNMYCDHCNCVIFAATKAVEDKYKSSLLINSSNTFGKKESLPIKITPVQQPCQPPTLTKGSCVGGADCYE
jgi:hypothetical protein